MEEERLRARSEHGQQEGGFGEPACRHRSEGPLWEADQQWKVPQSREESKLQEHKSIARLESGSIMPKLHFVSKNFLKQHGYDRLPYDLNLSVATGGKPQESLRVKAEAVEDEAVCSENVSSEEKSSPRFSVDDRIMMLQRYHAKHGHLKIPNSIFNWSAFMSRMRQARRNTKVANTYGMAMTSDRIKALDEIGFDWVGRGVRSKQAAPKPNVCPASLYTTQDDEALTMRNIILRRDVIEVFEASGGESHLAIAGQIGLRCKFCKHRAAKNRAAWHTVFPVQLSG